MLVGAAASLVFYLRLDSGLVAIALDPAVSSVVYLALGFVAGFSEQFFLQTLNQVGGGSTPPAGSQEPPGEGADPLDAEPGR